MEIIFKPTFSDNWLITTAIGDSYYKNWKENAYPSWSKYCKKYDIGLIVFNEILDKPNSNTWKKANWHKLIAANKMVENNIINGNVLFLDTDIIISPFAKNIFDNYDDKKIAVVSNVQDLPQDLELTRRRISFLRHTHLDEKYPLDSAIFMSPAEMFAYDNLPQFDNYCTTGVFVFNIKNHADLLKSWYLKYQRGLTSLTGGGEQPHLNYELQNWGHLQWLPYSYQALWTYEISIKYPFLYNPSIRTEELTRHCIEASLYSHHFLHFAGSWSECDMWKIGGFFESKDSKSHASEFDIYLETAVTGKPAGIIKPDKNN